MEKSETESDSDNDGLSHEELMAVTGSTLSKLLPMDPVLCDLPIGVTLEEVNSQVALQFGRSMTVYIERDDGEELPVVVPQGTATVFDLKHSLQRYTALKMMRQKLHVKVSWKHVWRNYWLTCNGQTLRVDSQLLSTYNIQNRSRVRFVKRFRERNR